MSSAALEAGDQSLEETIAAYERAVALQRRCERLLAEAELRVQQLMARADGSLAVDGRRSRTSRQARLRDATPIRSIVQAERATDPLPGNRRDRAAARSTGRRRRRQP